MDGYNSRIRERPVDDLMRMFEGLVLLERGEKEYRTNSAFRNNIIF